MGISSLILQGNLSCYRMPSDEITRQRMGGGGEVTCICRDTRMCHYFRYFFGGLPDFWVFNICLVKFICLGITQIFGYCFGYLINYVAECRLQGFCFLFSSVRFDLFL